MPVPDYQSLMLPTLRLAADGETRVADVSERVADDLGLSQAERDELLPSGRQRLLHNRIHWAKFYMSKAGLIASPARGRFVATDKGKALLATSPERIDVALLMQEPGFREFYRNEGAATDENGCRALSTIIDADGIDVRDWYAILQKIAKADAPFLQGEFHTGSELGEELVGPARFKIELHVNDITRAPENLCGFADLSQSLEFLVALMFKEPLELLLGHCFLRLHLQFGKPRVEFAADHLCLPMIRTMKGQ